MRICSHMYPPCVTRLQRSKSAASVGGRFSSELDLCAKKCFLASFTVSSPHVLLYRSTTYFSMVCRSDESRVTGALARLRRESVRESQIFHASQHVFFPCPANDEVVSHPVRQWDKDKAATFLCPRFDVIVWAPICRNVFLVPKATQSFAISRLRTAATASRLPLRQCLSCVL